MKYPRTVSAIVLCLVSIVVAQTRPAGGAQKVPPSKPTTTKPKFKEIWEPVNYPDDIFLRDVFFVSETAGWVGGYSARAGGSDTGGILIHTQDGGEHWDLQLGDPESSQPGFDHIYFVDLTHGWVVQKDKLLRTSDGKNWEEAGSLPPGPLHAYVFTSPTSGLALTGFPTEATSVYVTQDASGTGPGPARPRWKSRA